jgi:hypothetical protein
VEALKNMRVTAKKMTIFVVFAISGMILQATALYADPVNINDTIYLYQGIGGAGGGGAFNLKNSPSGNVLFETFCVEKNEFFSPGELEKVAGISSYAKTNNSDISKGYDGSTGDPLDRRTAYLYYHFRLGDLNTLASLFKYNDPASYNALQEAIWYIENEGGSSNYLVELADKNAVDSLYGVQVLNLTSLDGRIQKQDQLTLVPEPSTLLLLGAGLLGLGIFGRKKFKAKA